MDYSATERSGRFYLRSLLCVIFILMAVQTLLPYRGMLSLPRSLPFILLTALTLLPSAVVFWAFCRGSWPGLVVFVLGTFQFIERVTDLFYVRDVELMASPYTLVGVLCMLLRLTVFFMALRGDGTARYLERRREVRLTRDHFIEGGVFLLSFIVAGLAESYSYGLF